VDEAACAERQAFRMVFSSEKKTAEGNPCQRKGAFGGY
jgi:hypothetical protein